MNSYLLESPRPVEKEFTISDLTKILHRRRRLAIQIGSGVVLLAILYCAFATRRYEASGLIQVQKEGSTGIAMNDISGQPNAAGDSLDTTMTLATEVGILESDTLALSVIKDLNLEQNEDFKPHFDAIGWVFGLVSPKGQSDPHGASLDDSPKRRAHMLKVFAKHLTVKQTSGTRLIEVDFVNRDPKVAAAVVNHLIQDLSDYTFQTKLASASEGSRWLAGQLGDLRKQSEEDQAKVAALQKETGMFSLGTDAAGREQIYSDTLDRLQQSTAALSAADQNRILKEAVYKAVKDGNGELISELSGTTASGAAQPVGTALTLIQNLREQQSNLQGQIAVAQQKYGSAYPRMIELRDSLTQVNKDIQDETERVAERAKNDFDVAQQTENNVRAEYETNRAAANALKDKQVDYAVMREDAEQSRGLYEDILRKLKETGVLEGMRASDIAVVDPGRVPDKPSKPNIPIVLLASIVLGGIFGFAGALVGEGLDKRVHTIEDIEMLGMPMIGLLPAFRKDKKSIDTGYKTRTLDAPQSAYSEAVRGLRATSLVARISDPPKVLLVTSASQGEGKSTTARNLAASLAQQGKRVLLVDADMRRPAEVKEFYTAVRDGLSVILSGENATPSLIEAEGSSNFFVLPAGPVPANPSELLGSPKMADLLLKLKAQFDIVILDAPPVLPVVDAVILSELADSTLLVARQGVSVKESVQRSYQILSKHVQRGTIGIVLNGVETKSHAYQSYFGHNTSHYYQETFHDVA